MSAPEDQLDLTAVRRELEEHGFAAEFDIHVLRADQPLRPSAERPVDFEVAYRFVSERRSVIVDAEIKLGSERP